MDERAVLALESIAASLQQWLQGETSQVVEEQQGFDLRSM